VAADGDGVEADGVGLGGAEGPGLHGRLTVRTPVTTPRAAGLAAAADGVGVCPDVGEVPVGDGVGVGLTLCVGLLLGVGLTLGDELGDGVTNGDGTPPGPHEEDGDAPPGARVFLPVAVRGSWDPDGWPAGRVPWPSLPPGPCAPECDDEPAAPVLPTLLVFMMVWRSRVSPTAPAATTTTTLVTASAGRTQARVAPTPERRRVTTR
jgi:hypothetical protein